MNDLREKLFDFMGEKDLSVREVAGLLNRHPLTIWKFLHGKTAPHHQTLFQIRRLVTPKPSRHAQKKGDRHATTACVDL